MVHEGNVRKTTVYHSMECNWIFIPWHAKAVCENHTKAVLEITGPEWDYPILGAY